jgi:hypothetical protein
MDPLMQAWCAVDISRRGLVDLERCYEVLGKLTAGQDIGPIESLSEEEAAAVLDLARVVAHSVERKAAPLVSFSMGRALAAADADGRLAAIRDAVARIERESSGMSPGA